MFSRAKENLFKEQFENAYKPKLEKIRKYISTKTNFFKLDEIPIGIDDILKRQDDSNYMGDLGISYNDESINVLMFNKEFYYDIRDFIPKTITKLEVPSNFIKYDINFLSSFPNLKTLVITDYASLTKEEIIFLNKNTSITEINSEYIVDYQNYCDSDGFSYCDGPNKFALYNKLIINSSQKSSVDYMRIFSHDISLIPNVLSYNKNEITGVTEIYLDDKSKILIQLEEKKLIKNIKIETGNLDNVNGIYNCLSERGYKIEKITYVIKDKKYYNKDLSSLNNLAFMTNLYIRYGDSSDAIYNEFIGLQETIKWTTKIINETNLSPVEKLMFAFDFMKTFKYNESPIEKMDSREPHRILETGHIVCAGYSSLLEEIINNLDIGIDIKDVSVSCYDKEGNFRGHHARNMVKIDDNKYNIHGIFIIDSTWDSIKHDNIPQEYNALDLYRYFLVPAIDYKNIFPYDTIPSLFKIYLNEELNDYEKPFSPNESLYTYNAKTQLGVEMDDDSLKKYLSTSRPNLEQFKEILYNVRLSEGYSIEEAKKDVEKVVKFNVDVINENNVEGTNMTFFEERMIK